MSYTILYRSMFVRVADNKYIPMVEMGSNNVYEGRGGNARRCRDWLNWNVDKGGFVFTREEIMADVHAMIQRYKDRYVNRKKNPYDENCNEYYTFDEVSRDLGWFAGLAVGGRGTSRTSERVLINFFNKGFEQAVDFDNPNCQIMVVDGNDFRYASSYDELVEITKDGTENMYLKYGHGVETLWDERQPDKVKKAVKVHNEGWVVRYKGYYVNKITKARLFPARHIEYAHVYMTENAAKKVVGRILAGWECTQDDVDIAKVEKNAVANIWELV